ncbi:CD276 antigen isoform X2 [Kryptolebias marmoratus]|uniref:CD276 antigen isoform X2 n=1 Tax=Kryptolebias marmoratus TaxID=37003 RepID=UPI0007F86C3F|nr:CD276 antigen isoform X2 [Kryptolebias marmoratus]
MSENKNFMVLVVLICLWTLSRGDPEVTCVFNSSCLLPCQFQVGSDPLIHWILMRGTANIYVHSYYENQDQLGNQDQLFKGRTSMFKDQISRGNASLLLRGVKVQDEGRYKCYTSTTGGNKESFISLKTETPVSEVSISQEGNRITCSSEGIYPEPELTWSTSPPSNMELQDRPRVQQTEEQLYSISSSLMVSDRDPDLSYSCTVRTQRNQRNQRTATLNNPASVDGSETEATIPCSSSDVPVSNFTWRFNHSQIILTKTEGETSSRVSEEWRKHVEEVSESGSLTLKDLSSTHEGVYTCEARNKEETIISNIFLRISEGSSVWKVVLGVIGVIGVIAAAVFVIKKKQLLCFKQKPNSSGYTPTNTNGAS